MKPENYYSSVNEDLLALIPPDAKTVLEIGCGEGALCEAYRRVNPGVKWTGIEPHQESCQKATAAGIDAIWGTAENCMDPRPWTGHRCGGDNDCLIFGDVLEHMHDPLTVLRWYATHFAKSGAQVLACIPNVQHWTIIRDLLDGKWDYADSGLMDRTHLRWFTLKSIREMFEQAGLQVFEIIGRDLFNDGMDDFIRESGVAVKKEMRAYQYLVRAIKPERWQDRYKGHEVAVLNDPNSAINPIDSSINRIPKLHIHAVLAEDCCARPRILEPLAMLRTIPGVRCRTNGMIPPDTDIVILQRPRLPLCDKGILAAHQDKVLIVEIDDHPDYIGIDPLWLRGCHAIQCSTEALAEVCRQYNPNVMVFENQIAELPPMKHSAIICSDQPELLCAWQNREADWAPIIDALNDVLEDHPLVEVRVIHDQKFYDALTTDNKKFNPFCTYKEYRHRLGQASIALLPLEDTPFNRCKSDIKFLECAAEGVAVLTGDTVYEDTLRIFNPRVPLMGMTYHQSNPFEMALRRMIDDPALRCEMTTNAYAYVRDNRMLSQHYKTRHRWYLDLLARRKELQRDLLMRVPELARMNEPSVC